MDPNTPIIHPSESNIETVSNTSSNSTNNNPYRIFVRNLPPNTSEETLRAYFNRMGSVVDAFIFLDPFGVPLDLAVVSFRDECVADFFVQKRFHDFLLGSQIETVELLSFATEQQFDARTVDDVSRDARNDHDNLHPGNLHTISPKPQPQAPPGMSKDTIVVLNLRPKVTKEVLRTYFNRFGIVKSVAVRRKGNKKKRAQGFHAFVTFVCEESVRGALLLDDEDDEANEETFHELLGVNVQVKRSRK
jgi:RNA recognition motif-containing protein